MTTHASTKTPKQKDGQMLVSDAKFYILQRFESPEDAIEELNALKFNVLQGLMTGGSEVSENHLNGIHMLDAFLEAAYMLQRAKEVFGTKMDY